ncbi:MAG: hypothetical protein O3A20_00900 [Planctomycetota bacterium]|nr:hypothetical protein [Planctomycetota bacterium]
MTTIRELQRSKSELLERYSAARLEEMIGELRSEAVEQAEADRFPWKGEFRPREEVLFYYGERKRWDRRFLLDMAVMVVVVLVMAYLVNFGIKLLMPLPPEGRVR